jgi:hypothetical protein
LHDFIEHRLKWYELDYWNGTVVNAAHGMIAICNEFMRYCMYFCCGLLYGHHTVLCRSMPYYKGGLQFHKPIICIGFAGQLCATARPVELLQ